MSNNDKNYHIYLRSTKERIPCTKEEFDNYYRDINAYRRTQMNHGRCVCPSTKYLMCDMDCMTCPFHRPGDRLSLDYTVTDDEGNEKAWIDDLADPAPLIEDIMADSQQLERLFVRLRELMPEAIQIGELRQQGLSDDAIAAEIGTARSTFAYRLKKARKVIEKEFPEFF